MIPPNHTYIYANLSLFLVLLSKIPRFDVNRDKRELQPNARNNCNVT